MMRNILYVTTLLLGSFIFLQCGSKSSSGTNISGKIANAEGITVMFDKISLNTSNILDRVETNGSGGFSFHYDEPLDEGVYRVRLGAKSLMFLDGKHQNINITGDLQTIQNAAYSITGSEASETYRAAFDKIRQRQMNGNAFTEFVDTTSNAMVSAYLAAKYLPPSEQTMETHKAAREKLSKQYALSPLTNEYTQFVGSVEAQLAAQLAKQKVRVGEEAPEISLPNVKGKTVKLSDFKGKVVVLDFWASWCGPCRRYGNPELVKLYKKHKKDDFVIYQVSLDRPNGGERWKAAIEKDGLVWPHHVSDLQGWSSIAAKTYGVSSIPRAFIIDKEGKIAGVNVKGAQMEKKVAELLNS